MRSSLVLSLALPTLALAQRPSSAPSRILVDALKLHQAGAHFDATRELHRVVEGEGNDSARNKQRAELLLAQCLHRLGLHEPAFAFLTRIQQHGSAHPHYLESLSWTLALAAKLPDASGLARRVARYDRSLLAQPALARERWELALLYARGLAQGGDAPGAIALLRGVPQASAVYARARLLAGLLHAQRGAGKPALAAFAEAKAAAEKRPGDRAARALVEAALLHLARVSLFTGARDESIKHYAKLAPASPHGPEAQLATAYVAHGKKDAKAALDGLHRLHGFRFAHRYFPEGLVLRAAIYLERGEHERAEEALRALARSFDPMRKELEAKLAAFREADALLAELRRAAAQAASKESGQAARAVLDDPTVQERLQWIAELEREARLVQAAPAPWKGTAVAGVVLQDLVLQRSLADHEAGQLAQRRASAIVARLRALAVDAARLQAALAHCRAAKRRARVEVKLEPIMSALFIAREGATATRELFTLALRVSSD
jgi:hypothetical protein